MGGPKDYHIKGSRSEKEKYPVLVVRGWSAPFTSLPKCTCYCGVYWWVFVDDVGFVFYNFLCRLRKKNACFLGSVMLFFDCQTLLWNISLY